MRGRPGSILLRLIGTGLCLFFVGSVAIRDVPGG